MEYIIFDLEWNQPVYSGMRITSPVFLEGEVIEIGAVKTNNSCELLDTFKILISPKYYKKMNTNVSKLTGIGNKELMKGIVFPDAFSAFMKWCGTDVVFMSWSNNDLRVLRENLRLFHMDPDLYMKEVYDLQQFFDRQILHEGRSCGLSEALEKVGESGMEAHDALHDAINTFYVTKHLDLEEGIKTYEAPIEDFDDGEPISTYEHNYSVARDAYRDTNLLLFICSECGEKVECLPWAVYGDGKRVSKATCSCGQEYFVKLRYLNIKNGGKKAVRSVFNGSEKMTKFYESKVRKQSERYEKRKLRVNDASKRSRGKKNEEI